VRFRKTMSEPNEIVMAYEPQLIPPPELMLTEGINVIEEWFRWAEEWSVLLRVYGGLQQDSRVLEIGCGLGRIAFPLRYVLTEGSYSGFDICGYKIKFLKETFELAHPNFSFAHADIHNTEYNPKGVLPASGYSFPYADGSFDLVYAASVFTHMLPENTAHYFQEAGRVLRPGGCCLFSFFLLDLYVPGRKRPVAFESESFDFDVSYGKYGDDFAAVDAGNLERMTAYRLRLIGRFAEEAGLRIEKHVPGMWSGAVTNWIGAQDLVVMRKVE
jgi:SAM-dependent methyltransferase